MKNKIEIIVVKRVPGGTGFSWDLILKIEVIINEVMVIKKILLYEKDEKVTIEFSHEGSKPSSLFDFGKLKEEIIVEYKRMKELGEI